MSTPKKCLRLTGTFFSEHDPSKESKPARQILAVAILYSVWETLKSNPQELFRDTFTVRRDILSNAVYRDLPNRRVALNKVGQQLDKLSGILEKHPSSNLYLVLKTRNLEIDVLSFLRSYEGKFREQAAQHFHGLLLEGWNCEWKNSVWFQELQDELIKRYLACPPSASDAARQIIANLRVQTSRHIEPLIHLMRERGCMPDAIAACHTVCEKSILGGDAPPTLDRRNVCGEMRQAAGIHVPACPYAISRSPNNLPWISDHFFAPRETEISKVRALLRDNPFVTIIGSPGIGKTRTAIELTHELVEANTFLHGVWLVPLTAVTHRDQLAQTILTVMNPQARPQENQTYPEALRDVCKDKQLLLVLDRCEHLVEPVRDLIDNLLSMCPGIKILVTSQAVIGSDYEVVYKLGPLRAPHREEIITGQSLAEYPATRLFMEHARELSEIPNDDLAKAIAAICDQLDGNPLAIELAASRVGPLKIPEISADLSGLFEVLRNEHSDVTQHRSLFASIEWSFRSLTRKEQCALERLSVFVGGWTVHTAKEVISGPELSKENVPYLLESLARKSLIETTSKNRMRMLDSIRAFSRQRLIDSGQLEAVETRYCEFFAEFAWQHNRESWFQETALIPIQDELANIFEVIAICRRQPTASNLEIKIVEALSRYWDMRGSVVQGMEQMDTTRLRAAGTDPDAALFGRLLTSLGFTHLRRWEKDGYKNCRFFYEQALQIAIQAENKALVNKCEADLFAFAEEYDDLSPEYLERMRSAPKETILFTLALREHKLGNLAAAERLYRRVVTALGTFTLHVALAEGELSALIFNRLNSETNLTDQERADRVTEANSLYGDSMRRRIPEASGDIALGLMQRIGWLMYMSNLKEAAQLYGTVYRITEQRNYPHNLDQPFFKSLLDGSADSSLLAALEVGRNATIEESVQFAIDCGELFYAHFVGNNNE